jgi:hypothetical protein
VKHQKYTEKAKQSSLRPSASGEVSLTIVLLRLLRYSTHSYRLSPRTNHRDLRRGQAASLDPLDGGVDDLSVPRTQARVWLAQARQWTWPDFIAAREASTLASQAHTHASARTTQRRTPRPLRPLLHTTIAKMTLLTLSLPLGWIPTLRGIVVISKRARLSRKRPRRPCSESGSCLQMLRRLPADMFDISCSDYTSLRIIIRSYDK